MAFCDNCGHELRSGAKFCGSCGNPITETETTSQAAPSYTEPPPKQKRSMGKAKKFGIGLVIFIVVIGVLGAIGSSVSSGPTFTTPQLSEQEIKDKALPQYPGHGALLHKNDEYVGKIIEHYGFIKFVYNNNVLMGSEVGYDHLKRLNYDSDSCILNRGDYIHVWSEVVGLDTYSSLSGKQTVPELNALIIENRC